MLINFGIQMIYYTKDEIQSSTVVARNFGSMLDSLKQKKLEKVAVMRNNVIEAILISVEEYERLNELDNIEEHKENFQIIKSRESESIDHGISLEEVLKEYGINIKTLKRIKS